MLSFFDIAALVLVLSAVFGWVNRRFIHLPHQIGLLILGLGAVARAGRHRRRAAASDFRDAFTAAIARIDFYDTMMNGMLAFLLFAGALHVDFGKLRSEAPAGGAAGDGRCAHLDGDRRCGDLGRGRRCSASTCRSSGRWSSAR